MNKQIIAAQADELGFTLFFADGSTQRNTYDKPRGGLLLDNGTRRSVSNNTGGRCNGGKKGAAR